MNHSYPEYLAGPEAYCGSAEINNSTQHINSKQMRENWDKTTYYDFSRGHISNIIHSRENINNISRKLLYPCSTWWTTYLVGVTLRFMGEGLLTWHRLAQRQFYHTLQPRLVVTLLFPDHIWQRLQYFKSRNGLFFYYLAIMVLEDPHRNLVL